MEAALKVINKMAEDKIIDGYAIGGAVALLFYAEPTLTYDLDIFIFLSASDQSPLIQLTPLYEYLKGRGYLPDKEHIVIEGIPVQFIPVYNPLVTESVHEAKDEFYNKTKIKVLQLEYLLAIMLDTNRPKDRQRISQILETVPYDRTKLKTILKKFGLLKKWEEKYEIR